MRVESTYTHTHTIIRLQASKQAIATTKSKKQQTASKNKQITTNKNGLITFKLTQVVPQRFCLNDASFP